MLAARPGMLCGAGSSGARGDPPRVRSGGVRQLQADVAGGPHRVDRDKGPLLVAFGGLGPRGTIGSVAAVSGPHLLVNI